MSPNLSEHPNYSYIEVVRASDYDSLERTVAELRGYSHHHNGCDKMKQMPMQHGRTYTAPDDFEEWFDKQACTCGLDALLARIDGSKP